MAPSEDGSGSVSSEASRESNREGNDPPKKEQTKDQPLKSTAAAPGDDDQDAGGQARERTKSKKRKAHRLSMTETEDFNKKLKRRGVVYVARVPPKMTPAKIKSLLSEFGTEVTRVYLVEEDAAARKRRRINGGSGRMRYVEGWVEFADKKKAKHIAASLNNTPISVQKRNAHYGDLWNLKYLSKFQWSHLTEKVAYERRVREQKLRVELMQSRRDNAEYVQLVERGKALDQIAARRKDKGDGDGKNEGKSERRRRKHRQTSTYDGASKATTNLALLQDLV